MPDEFRLSKDILCLWEQTVCEIRGEIKSWDLKEPHVSDYAKELCDKLEHSMCALAGGNYSLRYDIENTDIHKLTASRIFNVPYNKVTDEQRRIAKTLNFKELYK